MRTTAIVVGQIFMVNLPQMRLVENEQLVQAFAPHRTDPALCIRIGIRCAKRRANNMRTRRLEDGIEGYDELAKVEK